MSLEIIQKSNILQVDVTTQEETINVFSSPNVMRLEVSPSVSAPISSNDGFGVVKGSDSILIEGGIAKINTVYLTQFLSEYATESYVNNVNNNTIAYINQQLALLATSEYVNNLFHIEKNVVTNLSNRLVNITFDTPFTSTPVGWVRVYRMQQTREGTYREYDVLWGYTSVSKVGLTGFQIKISDSENLTGVVIEYEFK